MSHPEENRQIIQRLDQRHHGACSGILESMTKRLQSGDKKGARRRKTLKPMGGSAFLAVVLILCLSGAGCVVTGRYADPKKSGVPVTFTYRGNGNTVCLCGDFNGWSRIKHCLEKSEDSWSIRLELRPGRYRYVFVLDDDRLIPDPGNPLLEDDGLGNRNSLLIVD